jgi:hypothetical protein
MLRPLALSLACLAPALLFAQTLPDWTPFLLLGSNGPLNGSQVPVDNLSPSDKVVSCKGRLTYIDLDVQQMFSPPIQGPQFTLERCANPLARNSACGAAPRASPPPTPPPPGGSAKPSARPATALRSAWW